MIFLLICILATSAFAENVLFKYTGSKDPALIVPENVKVIKIGDNVYLSGERDVIESLFDNSTIKEINPPERKLKYTPNDEFYNNQWSLYNIADTDIDWPEAMEIFVESQEPPIVVVMDSGIAWNHPDLKESILTNGDFENYGFNFCPGENISEAYDKFGHGTHIAGIIGAVTNNTFGIAGVGNNNIKILNMKVTCDSDKVDFTAELAAISKILELKNKGYNIKFVNMSFGGPDFLQEEQDALQQLTDNDIYLFAAAGNNGTTTKDYPAGYDNVIAVGATDKNNGLSQYSNYGDWVDIYAPGESIFSTYAEYLAKPESLDLLDNYEDAFRDEFDNNNPLTTFKGGWRLDGSGHASIRLTTTGDCSDNVTNSILMGPFDSNLPDYRYKNIIISMKASSGSRIFVNWSTESQNWTNLLTQSGLNNMDYIYGITEIPAASSNFSLRICLEGSVGSQASIDAVRVSASDSPDAFSYEYGTSMSTPFVTAAAALGYIDKGQFSKSDLIENAEFISTSIGELRKLNLYDYLNAEFVTDNGTSQEDTDSDSDTTASDDGGGGGGGGCSIAKSSESNNILIVMAVLAAIIIYRLYISKNSLKK